MNNPRLKLFSGPVLLFITSITLLTLSASAQVNTSRSLGMGGAVVAATDPLSAPYFNPAALAGIDRMWAGASMSSTVQNYHGSNSIFRSVQAQAMPFENIGIAAPLGPGAAYVGFGSYQNYFGLWKNVIAGADISLDTKAFAPTVAYGLKISPSLSVGGALSYLYRYDQMLAEWDAGSAPMWKISRGLSANLSALYSLSTQIDIGASMVLNGPFNISGYADASDIPVPLLGRDFSITGAMDNPSTFKVGTSYKYDQATTLSLQFDVMNGFHMAGRQSARGDGGAYMDLDVEAMADTVVGTRIGLEHMIILPDAKMPIWMGFVFIPDNRMRFGVTQFDPNAALNAADITWLKVPNTSIFSLGVGYRAADAELSLSSEWMTGSSQLKQENQPALDSYATLQNKLIGSLVIWL